MQASIATETRQEISERLHFLRISLSLDLRSYGQDCCPRTSQHAPELLPLTSAACTSSLASGSTPGGKWPGEEELAMGDQMGQCHSVALQVGAGTGGLARDSCNGHWLQRMGRRPSTELKGVKALWELL